MTVSIFRICYYTLHPWRSMTKAEIMLCFLIWRTDMFYSYTITHCIICIAFPTFAISAKRIGYYFQWIECVRLGVDLSQMMILRLFLVKPLPPLSIFCLFLRVRWTDSNRVKKIILSVHHWNPNKSWSFSQRV